MPTNKHFVSQYTGIQSCQTLEESLIWPLSDYSGVPSARIFVLTQYWSPLLGLLREKAITLYLVLVKKKRVYTKDCFVCFSDRIHKD